MMNKLMLLLMSNHNSLPSYQALLFDAIDDLGPGISKLSETSVWGSNIN